MTSCDAREVLFNCLLCLLGWLPGIIHAMYLLVGGAPLCGPKRTVVVVQRV